MTKIREVFRVILISCLVIFVGTILTAWALYVAAHVLEFISRR